MIGVINSAWIGKGTMSCFIQGQKRDVYSLVLAYEKAMSQIVRG